MGASFLFLFLLPLPLIDEIVASGRFENLCKENEFIFFDKKNAVGKTVYLDSVANHSTETKIAFIPIRLQTFRYVDVKTGGVIISYNILHADGGLLVRVFGVSSHGPITFKSFCEPKNAPYSIETFKKLGIYYIEPPVN
ncbi:hypothetical protein C1H71_01620 [Iodobacter fluviatilis]|uniref:Uncharacterized protein n=1 Tax=Iodobacter fluviatilis TaxID=537 RepID=A0A7G3G554_9NEIS|nr:hypothetical protein C1H71_01620 [Iodobacter fluviatilis]